jgi:UDP-N-acetylglucosamine transferase subunit ALG13
MIFVTVGTHEQQFNRLVKEVDNLIEKGQIKEEMFVQLGYSDYIPKNCIWKKLLSYDRIEQYLDEARIVITHGGPATFMNVIQKGKVPIVVPRQKQFGEHVNNHQLEFAKRLVEEGYSLDVVEDVSDLWYAIKRNENTQEIIKSRNEIFVENFKKLVIDMVR